MKHDLGIIGGAGPMAGSLFLNRVITWFQRERGAWQDQDFPSVVLVNYPFSDMLRDDDDDEQIFSELSEAINSLSSSYYVVACNTLHSYFRDSLPQEGQLHLMKITADNLREGEIPLVLCSSTSRRYAIHKKYFDCSYPSQEGQLEIDEIIETILRGQHDETTARRLEQVFETELAPGQRAVLGCTELSLIVNDHRIPTGKTIDPCELAVEKVCKLITEKIN